MLENWSAEAHVDLHQRQQTQHAQNQSFGSPMYLLQDDTPMLGTFKFIETYGTTHHNVLNLNKTRNARTKWIVPLWTFQCVRLYFWLFKFYRYIAYFITLYLRSAQSVKPRPLHNLLNQMLLRKVVGKSKIEVWRSSFLKQTTVLVICSVWVPHVFVYNLVVATSCVFQKFKLALRFVSKS